MQLNCVKHCIHILYAVTYDHLSLAETMEMLAQMVMRVQMRLIGKGFAGHTGQKHTKLR